MLSDSTVVVMNVNLFDGEGEVPGDLWWTW